jgi:glycosyltransferase involved in cell wall biosynthesis
MSKVKVAHIITGLNTGGAERMLTKIVKPRSQQSVSHSVLSLTDKGYQGRRIEENGVHVGIINAFSMFDMTFRIGKLRRKIDHLDPHVIQGWMYHGNIASLMGKWISNKERKVVWNVRHSLDDVKNEKWQTRLAIYAGAKLSRLPENIVYNSQRSSRQHTSFGYCGRDKKVIPNGFDCNKYKPDKGKRKKFRKSLKIDSNTRLVGNVSRSHPMKDHKTFIQSAKYVSDRIDDVEFVIVGRGVPSNKKIKNFADKVGIINKVYFLGQSKDIPAVMNGIDVFALSSAWGEAFPNVLGEAMACGTPCVATDVGDSSLIIGDKGAVVPTKSPQNLAVSICETLKGMEESGVVVSKCVRNRIEKNYSINRVQKMYNNMYINIERECNND